MNPFTPKYHISLEMCWFYFGLVVLYREIMFTLLEGLNEVKSD